MQSQKKYIIVLGYIFKRCCIVLFLLLFFITSAEAFGTSKWAELPRERSSRDINENGVSDTDDILQGAKDEVARRPVYRSAYYRGGYPPAGEGVCTDVIWRAFQYAGYDLKKMVDADIRRYTSLYSRVGGKPDPHIDFRRLPNLTVFFKRHGQTLTTKIIPNDRENLILWQPGDVVVFTNPDHIAILSDKRNSQGIPYLLHNDGPWATESDSFMFWYAKGIVAHFRFPPD